MKRSWKSVKFWQNYGRVCHGHVFGAPCRPGVESIDRPLSGSRAVTRLCVATATSTNQPSARVWVWVVEGLSIASLRPVANIEKSLSSNYHPVTSCTHTRKLSLPLVTLALHIMHTLCLHERPPFYFLNNSCQKLFVNLMRLRLISSNVPTRPSYVSTLSWRLIHLFVKFSPKSIVICLKMDENHKHAPENRSPQKPSWQQKVLNRRFLFIYISPNDSSVGYFAYLATISVRVFFMLSPSVSCLSLTFSAFRLTIHISRVWCFCWWINICPQFGYYHAHPVSSLSPTTLTFVSIIKHIVFPLCFFRLPSSVNTHISQPTVSRISSSDRFIF